MTTVKKSATKKIPSKSASHVDALPNEDTQSPEDVKPAKAKKLSTDERLEALIVFLKQHGLHFDGAAIEE